MYSTCQQCSHTNPITNGARFPSLQNKPHFGTCSSPSHSPVCAVFFLGGMGLDWSQEAQKFEIAKVGRLGTAVRTISPKCSKQDVSVQTSRNSHTSKSNKRTAHFNRHSSSRLMTQSGKKNTPRVCFHEEDYQGNQECQERIPGKASMAGQELNLPNSAQLLSKYLPS